MNRRTLLILMTVMFATAVAGAANPEPINLRKTVTVEVVAKTKGAVVNISTTKLISQRVGPFGGDPFFQQFGGGETVRIPAQSLGSGFLVHEDGYVVTNNHVIDRARQIHVELEDGRKLPATLISADPEHDLAILKISDPKPFPTLALGDSGDLMIGEPAIAIGNPLGFSHSVSTGIISAVHRDLKDQGGHVMLANVIQTDAAINPGNSGGPLLNAYGQVIGINTAIRSDAQNIGFAIPINRLRELIPELLNPSVVTKTELKLKLKERRVLTEPAGVECHVETDEPTPREVTAINGKRPRDLIDAYVMLLRARPGDAVTLREGGQTETIRAAAVPLPDAIVQAKRMLGLTVEPLTPMLAEKYHLEAEDGLFVSAVARASVAEKAGLQPGDIIVQLGRYRVANLDDFSALLQRLPETGRMRIGVVRGDEVGFGVLDLGP